MRQTSQKGSLRRVVCLVIIGGRSDGGDGERGQWFRHVDFFHPMRDDPNHPDHADIRAIISSSSANSSGSTPGSEGASSLQAAEGRDEVIVSGELGSRADAAAVEPSWPTTPSAEDPQEEADAWQPGVQADGESGAHDG
eukprot:gene18960-22661_t